MAADLSALSGVMLTGGTVLVQPVPRLNDLDEWWPAHDGVPLGADHPPGGCPQQPRQVVNNDRSVAATPGIGKRPDVCRPIVRSTFILTTSVIRRIVRYTLIVEYQCGLPQWDPSTGHTYAVCSTVLVRRWRRVLLSLYNGLWLM